MSSRAIKPKRDGGLHEPTWQAIEERAPSVVRRESLSIPRSIAVVGLGLITVGAVSHLCGVMGWRYMISTGLGWLMLILGFSFLLYHAFSEKDIQFQRLYGMLALLLVGAGAVLRVLPLNSVFGGGFLPYGAVSWLLALGFLLSYVRNESEETLRTYAEYLLAILAVVNGLTGFIGGLISEGFLLQTGIIHLVLGLLFAAGFVAMAGVNSRRGYWAGAGIGILGAAMLLVALIRSLLPMIYVQLNWGGRPPSSFFLPSGLILMYLGVEYLFVFLGICSDNKLVVLTRRELGEFFFSPIAYIVFIAMTILGWCIFVIFMFGVWDATDRGGMPMMEPIVSNYLISFLVLIPLIFLAPVITMRMLSEEKRSGTLEVLLTAPVNEWQVVLAKFFAALRVFSFCWIIWAVFFLALRVEGDRPFDYRPLIVFMISLVCMGAGFMAMGLFFSSLTRHQILAAVFTFLGMMTLTLLYILGRSADTGWVSAVISYVSYIDLWIEAARGKIVPKLLVYNLTVAVFWLFLTVKVLEARKWS